MMTWFIHDLLLDSADLLATLTLIVTLTLVKVTLTLVKMFPICYEEEEVARHQNHRTKAGSRGAPLYDMYVQGMFNNKVLR